MTTKGKGFVLTTKGKRFIQSLLDELERDGVVVKTGEMRPSGGGELQPIYVLSPEYAKRFGSENAVIDAVLERYATRH
jgi:hypothetical protein